MTSALRDLAALVRRETGNELPEGRLPYLREAAERRCRATGRPSLDDYVAALGADEIAGEWEALASLLTIKESTFFRVPLQWDRIRDRLLPELVQARAASRRLRFWSAACAAGEEPATLALVLDESPLLTGWDWRILATDLDPDALAQARRGLYGERAIAAVPPRMLAGSFVRQGALFELAARLRARIDYRQMNLARLPYRLPEPGFDIVLLRNVLIYFRQQLQAEVVREVSRRLLEPGALFLGGSETLWRVQDRLQAVDLGGCFCYRLPVEAEAPRRGRVASPPAAARTPRPKPEASGAAGRTPRVTAASSPPPETAAERILAAIRHLESDRADEAERAATAALARDPADPAVHALAGVLHELAGRTEAAADAFRAALYLDPELPQIRLRLALTLRRSGREEAALRNLREVVTTLERGAGRTLPALDGRLLPTRAEALSQALAALQLPSSGG